MQETFNNRQSRFKQSKSSNERIDTQSIDHKNNSNSNAIHTIKALDYINPRNKKDLLKHHERKDKR